MPFRRALLVWLLAACLSGESAAQQRSQPAPAAPPAPALSETAKQLIGAWEFSNADRDRICTLNFKPEPAPGGFKLEFDRNCATLYPIAKEIVAWRYTDNELLRLLDARGRVLAEFTEVENGIFEAPTPGIGLLFLQNAALAGPAPRNAEQMAGEWTIMRADKPVCALSLANTPSGEAFALRIKPGCDAAVTRFNPDEWRMDRGELVLSTASGESWRFEEGDAGIWRRIPERAGQLTMVRK